MSTQLIRPFRPMREVVADWAGALAERLGRPAEAILARGLGATDFSPLESVEIRFDSGMTIRIPFAFALLHPEEPCAVVFSEHSGYLEFDLPDDTAVVSVREHYRRIGRLDDE